MSVASLGLATGLIIKDFALLSLCSSAILSIAIAAWISHQHARHFRLKLILPTQVQAERSFPAKLEIACAPDSLPMHPLQWQWLIDKHSPLSFRTPKIAPATQASLSLRGRPLPRANYDKWTFVWRSSFPLNLITNVGKLSVNAPLIVVPQAKTPKELEFLGSRGHPFQKNFGRSFGADEEFSSLRKFQAGDPVKKIHWPSSNRGLGLVIKEVDFPINLPNLITVLFHSPSQQNLILPKQFEQALKLLLGTCQTLIQNGYPFTLSADFLNYQIRQLSSPAHLNRLTHKLACAQRCKTPKPQSLRQQLQLHQAAELIILVTDAPLDLENLSQTATDRKILTISP